MIVHGICTVDVGDTVTDRMTHDRLVDCSSYLTMTYNQLPDPSKHPHPDPPKQTYPPLLIVLLTPTDIDAMASSN